MVMRNNKQKPFFKQNRGIYKSYNYLVISVLAMNKHFYAINSLLQTLFKNYLRILTLLIISACSASDVGLPDYIAADDSQQSLINVTTSDVELNSNDSKWIQAPNVRIKTGDKVLIDVENKTRKLCPSLRWTLKPSTSPSEVSPPGDFTLDPKVTYTILVEKADVSDQTVQCNNFAKPWKNGENLVIQAISSQDSGVGTDTQNNILQSVTNGTVINYPVFSTPGAYYTYKITPNDSDKRKLYLSVGCNSGTGSYSVITHIYSSECSGFYDASKGTTTMSAGSNGINYTFMDASRFDTYKLEDQEGNLNQQQTYTLPQLKNNKVVLPENNFEEYIFFKIPLQNGVQVSDTSKYKVTVKVYRSKITTPIGDFLNSLITPIKDSSHSASQQIYEGIIGNTGFKQTVKVALILYITIYSIMFTLGMTAINHKDLLERTIKIALMLILISENSWTFFNEYCLNFFTKGMEELLYHLTGTQATDSAGVFGFVDKIFKDIFATNNLLKLTSFLFNLHGIVILILILIFICIYLLVILESFIGYLIAILCISLMISLAPLFIILLLFENTKKYFEGWFKYLVNFAIQPVILFTMINILNQLVIIAYLNMLNFSVEWGPVTPIILDINFILRIFGVDFITLPIISLFSINYYVPTFVGEYVITSFTTAMVFALLVSVMKAVLDLAPQISNTLTSVTQGGGTSFTGRGSIASYASQRLKSVVGSDDASKQRRAYDKKVRKAAGV